MGLSKALLVSLTFLGMALSLPLTSSDAAPVSCFTSGLSAPTDDLFTALYDFCANMLPGTNKLQETSFNFNKTFELAGGSNAFLSIDLDDPTSDLTTSECLYMMGTAVTDCESEGKSTGGEYSNGSSNFTVEVTPPAQLLTRSGLDTTSDILNLSARQTGVQPAQCWIKLGQPPVLLHYAIRAATDFCKIYNGRQSAEGDDFGYVLEYVVPHIYVGIHAYRSMSTFEAACLRSFEPIWAACTLDGLSKGGYVKDALAEYMVNVYMPDSEASAKNAVNGSDSAVAERSAGKEIAGPFNATDSTNGLFTTSCNSFPWSQNPISIDFSSASTSADIMCRTWNGRVYAKGEQDSATFNTNPMLFTDVLALENFAFKESDCNAAFDTLFKACVWNNRYYGGKIEYAPAQYVLEIPPAGLSTSSAVSTTFDISARSVTPGNSTDACTSDVTHSTSQYFATAAAWLACSVIGASNWMQGQIVSLPVPDAEHGQSLLLTIEASVAANMTPGFCFNEFSTLISDCTADDSFSGAVTTNLGFTFAFKITDPAAVSAKPIDASDIDHSAIFSEKAPLALGTGDCDKNGVEVDKVSAYSAATALCFELGDANLDKGDGITHLYKSPKIWISARIVAQEHTSFTTAQCVVTFGNLISTCSVPNNFCGGTLDANGARFDLEVVQAPTDATTSSMTKRDDPYGVKADCVQGTNSNTVIYVQALGPAVDFCRRISDDSLIAGKLYSAVYQAGELWVHVNFESKYAATGDYENCIEMFNSQIQQCRGSSQTYSGSQLVFQNQWANIVINGDLNDVDKRDEPTALATRDGVYSAKADCITDFSSSLGWVDAMAEVTDFCRWLDGKFLQGGYDLINKYKAGDLWMSLHYRSQYGAVMDNFDCYDMFNSQVQQCRQGEMYAGGQLSFDNAWAQITISAEPLTKRDEQPTALAKLGGPYGVEADCDYVYTTSVSPTDALPAATKACRDLDGKFLEHGKVTTLIYRADGKVLYLNFLSSLDAVGNYETCIEMFDSQLQQCQYHDMYAGSTLWFEGQFAQIVVVDPTAAEAKSIGQSANATSGVLPRQKSNKVAVDTPASETANVLPRQKYNKAAIDTSPDAGAELSTSQAGEHTAVPGCLIAEATPIDKQTARNAIAQFCPMVGTITITGNTAVSATIETAGGIKIAMQIRANSATDYKLSDQGCIGGFEQLLTQCSGGVQDDYTKGGTLIEGDAAFTLSLSPF